MSAYLPQMAWRPRRSIYIPKVRTSCLWTSPYLKEWARNTAYPNHALTTHKPCGPGCPAHGGKDQSRPLNSEEWERFGPLALHRTKDSKVVDFIGKKMCSAKERRTSSFDDENSISDVGTFRRERPLVSSDDNSSNDQDTFGFESLPIERLHGSRQRSASLSSSRNLCTHISQTDGDSSSDSGSQVFEHNSPGSYDSGPSRSRSLSFGSTQELKYSPSPPPAFPPDRHPSARHSILVVVCLTILFLTLRLWQEDVLKANGILEISQFGNEATAIEEWKQDGSIEALNRLSENNVVSIVDRSREMPGAAQSSEEEEANGSKREGPLMHFLNSEDEPRFLRRSTTLTPSSTRPCLASLKIYSSDQAELSSREGLSLRSHNLRTLVWPHGNSVMLDFEDSGFDISWPL